MLAQQVPWGGIYSGQGYSGIHFLRTDLLRSYTLAVVSQSTGGNRLASSLRILRPRTPRVARLGEQLVAGVALAIVAAAQPLLQLGQRRRDLQLGQRRHSTPRRAAASAFSCHSPSLQSAGA